MNWIDINERQPEEGQEIIALHSNTPCAYYTNWKEYDSRGITHWLPFEPPVKKRWNPKYSEDYFFIDNDNEIGNNEWKDHCLDNDHRDLLGVYKTREEAALMRDKILKFVAKEIGEN